MSNFNVRVSRGFLVVCHDCHKHLSESKMIDEKGISVGDQVIYDLCPNCSDYNLPLINDLEGSSE